MSRRISGQPRSHAGFWPRLALFQEIVKSWRRLKTENAALYRAPSKDSLKFEGERNKQMNQPKESPSNPALLLFDGAFGTYYTELWGKDPAEQEPCELACLHHPERVLDIHREYLLAGAEVLKTNTFAANRVSLGLDEKKLEKLVAAGWSLAQEAAAGRGKVFADIGPAPLPAEQALEEHRLVIQMFLEQGADCFLFETMTDLEAFDAADAAREAAKKLGRDVFILVSFAVGQDGYTRSGISLEDLAKRAEKSSCDGFGINCICGPSHHLALARRLCALPATKRRTVMPNSCFPSVVDGRTQYVDNPAYFADKMMEIHRLGVEIVGGCCGTTPTHIAALAKVLKENGKPLQGQSISERRSPVPPRREAEGRFAVKLEEAFRSKGKKVVAVELDPPASPDFSHMAEAAPYLKKLGVDVITVADSPLARPRADSILISAKLQREFGVETLPHLSCRDRNAIGLKSVLIGGSMEGLQNLLIITGDPVPAEDRGSAMGKGMFSFQSFQLLEYLQRLNREVFQGREFTCGAALNVNVRRGGFSLELERAKKKQECGADFFLTQPIYTQEAAEHLKRASETLERPVLAGIMPIAGYRNAVFLNNEVPGIHIPEELIKSLEQVPPEEAPGIALPFAVETIRRCWDSCAGFYLMTPLKKYRLVGELAKKIKEMEP